MHILGPGGQVFLFVYFLEKWYYPDQCIMILLYQDSFFKLLMTVRMTANVTFSEKRFC